MQSDAAPIFCRDSWIANMTLEHFEKFTCAKCFVQVFFDHKSLRMHIPKDYTFLLASKNNSNVTYLPDPEAGPQGACAVLSEDECATWRSCCKAARECCVGSQQTQTLAVPSCPSTWDGVSCWPATPGGSTRRQSCPDYYVLRDIQWHNPEAEKSCDPNGTWEVHPAHKREMTNYTLCFDTAINVEILKISLYIDFAGNGLSVSFLLAAIVLILASRSLRLELRTRISLKLHFSLFVAVLLNGVFTVLFHLVYYDAITNTADAVYLNNTVWCRLLHAITKYFKSATFLCMLCEGLYLFRRILNVLQVGLRESLLKYLLIGWGIPAIIVSIYVIVRIALDQNDKCWIEEGLSKLEFIHIVPNLLSLVCNLVFLVSIEWMLCTQMRSDTSDKRIEVLRFSQRMAHVLLMLVSRLPGTDLSSERHALRATLSLIPIFGLQFLFIIWRPGHWPPYEIIVALFTSTQGFLVAILYCFATQEVKEELQGIYTDCRRRRRMRGQSFSSHSSTKTSMLSRLSIDAVFARVRRFSCGLIPDLPEQRIRDSPEFPVDRERRDSSESRGTQETHMAGSHHSLRGDVTPPRKNSSHVNGYLAKRSNSKEGEFSPGDIPFTTLSISDQNNSNGTGVVVSAHADSTEPLLQKHVVLLHANGRTPVENEAHSNQQLTPIMEVESSTSSHS